MALKFEQFIQEVVSKIQDYLPSSFRTMDVEVQTIYKTNDLKLTGLLIRSKDNNVCPTIYLEKFFQEYKDGMDMKAVLENIADVRLRHEIEEGFDVEQITSFENIKDRIVPKIVNKTWNERLLSERPHTELADLAVIYQITLLQQSFEGSNASIPITNQLMNNWGITVEELHELALRNMTILHPSTLEPISKVLAAMMNEETAELFAGQEPEEEIMWVLSNSNRVNGAAAILDKVIMKTAVETLGDFVVIPSSVHELLLVKVSPDTEIDTISQMIKEVNQDQVSPDERLGDRPYRYSLEEGLIPA